MLNIKVILLIVHGSIVVIFMLRDTKNTLVKITKGREEDNILVELIEINLDIT